jgi:hypothetical protein
MGLARLTGFNPAPKRYIPELYPLVGALTVYALAWLLGPDHAGPEFYTASSQIIPILLLALGIEAGVLRFRRHGPDEEGILYELAEAHVEVDRASRDVAQPRHANSGTSDELSQAWEQLAAAEDRLYRALNAREAWDQGRRASWSITMMRTLYVVLLLVMFVSGEVTALAALAEAHPGSVSARGSFATVTMGTVLVALVAFVGLSRIAAGAERSVPRRQHPAPNTRAAQPRA